jgi:hypothetical protein
MANGLADAGVLVFDEDGYGKDALGAWGGEENADAAAFIAAATATVLVVKLDSDGGDGTRETFQGVGKVLPDEGTQGGGEGDAVGLGKNVHKVAFVRERIILGGLGKLVYNEVSDILFV